MDLIMNYDIMSQLKSSEHLLIERYKCGKAVEQKFDMMHIKSA
jgi:hypothetical protein